MKKWILSVFVIFIFGSYVFYQQNGGRSEIFEDDDDDDDNKPVQIVPAPVTPGTSAPSGDTPAPGTPATPAASGQYKDGAYTGNAVDAYYGLVQVKAVIQGGKLNDVIFLQYPNDRTTSTNISNQAMVAFKSEAIRIQAAKVNTISGATETIVGFNQSLSSALAQAK